MIYPANPKANYLAQKNAIDTAIHEVLDSGWYILGNKVKEFERDFAKYIHADHCIAVANGTDAIHLALRAIGVEAGDAVITVSNTAVATVSAIDWIGAVPVLADIDPETFTIDPSSIRRIMESELGAKVKAVIAVHLFGHPADLEELEKITGEYNLRLIEDCAQAHGARIDDKIVGSIGHVAGFSFYPTKNLGALGDGGAITTSNEAVADKVRLLQQYGWRERYISEEIGYNSRLDELQAAILQCKLEKLEENNDRRREIAAKYNADLANLPVTLPVERSRYHHVYHQYVIMVDDRDGLMDFLKQKEIFTSILYPVPIHRQKGYSERCKSLPDSLQKTEYAADHLLCLPVYPELTDNEVLQVIDGIKSFYSRD